MAAEGAGVSTPSATPAATIQCIIEDAAATRAAKAAAEAAAAAAEQAEPPVPVAAAAELPVAPQESAPPPVSVATPPTTTVDLEAAGLILIETRPEALAAVANPAPEPPRPRGPRRKPAWAQHTPPASDEPLIQVETRQP
jgi:ribonuclease E